jgi:peroxiredoxin
MRSRANGRFFSWIAAAILLAAASALIATGRAQSDNSSYQTSMKAASKMMQQSRFDEAVEEYKHAILLSGGKDFSPYYGLAKTYMGLLDLKDTISTCDQMIALAPNDAVRAQGHNLKGMAYLKAIFTDRENLPRAEAEFRKAIDLDSLYYIVHFYLGAALILDNHDAEAQAELKEYLAKDPDGEESDEAQAYVADPNALREGPDSYDSGSDDAKTQKSIDRPESSTKPSSNIVGTKAPDFTFITAEGKRMNLHDFHGKVVLLDFWATWCPVCREAMPGLKWIHEQVRDPKFAMVSISVDEDESKWRGFIEYSHLDWIEARDNDGRFLQKYYPAGQEMGIPDYFLIDGDGVIRKHYVGWSEAQDMWLVAGIMKWSKAASGTNASAAPGSH